MKVLNRGTFLPFVKISRARSLHRWAQDDFSSIEKSLVR